MLVLLIIAVVIIVAFLVACLWVNGIEHMNKNYPDYKGNDLFGGDEDDDDWENIK
jgi:FtsZ-interacting cell division protein ZipA